MKPAVEDDSRDGGAATVRLPVREILIIVLVVAGFVFAGGVVITCVLQAHCGGFVATTDGKVTRFDLVALGTYEGEGRYTRGAPDEPFPYAVSLRLADGRDTADAVPPQGSRGWLQGYLRAERR